jgi:pyruvate ferredoxin oxidoreductase alpha subunit
MGAYGPLFGEIRSALYDLEQPPLVYNRTFGLGGRELFPSEIAGIFEESQAYLQAGKVDKVFDIIGARGD